MIEDLYIPEGVAEVPRDVKQGLGARGEGDWFADLTERPADSSHSEKDQLRWLALQLTQAEERIRRDVAAVLHDQVGQMLTVCDMKLAKLVAEPDATHGTALLTGLLEVRGLIQQVIEQTRSLTCELAPPVLYEFGLSAGLRWLVGNLLEPQGLNVTCDIRLSTPLDPAHRMIVFSAVRELFLNVLKHANATTVTLCAWDAEHKLHVVVEDNGIGNAGGNEGDRRAAGTSFGLRNIRERLKHLGGAFDLRFSPAGPTRASLVLPLATSCGNA